jgi:predicted MPP superfamily phosphohydrolase
LIASIVTGLSELYANGRMAGNLVNDVFFNLDRAVDLIDQINTMEPMLPSDNTLPSILHSHSAKSLSDLQTFADLKTVGRTVTTIYQAEQERQHGTTAA